jgi:heme A synthase
MTRRHRRLAWAAATASYLLIILGAVVRITGSGLGCGDHWPLCNGRLLPPLDLPTWIEWSHRLVAALVSILVITLAGSTAWDRSQTGKGVGSGEWDPPSRATYVALGLLIIQIVLGAITVKLELPPWTVVLHLGTAMLLLAALLIAARQSPSASGLRPGLAATIALALAFVTVLFGALTANLGAASACLGFPLCNGQLVPDGNYLQHIHWTHRLLAYGFAGYAVWWAWRVPGRRTRAVLGVVFLQIAVAAAMLRLALPRPLQALHVAVGAGVWAAVVLAAW